MTFCFLRASLRFFWASYLNFPMSRILQTGGSALGEISTRSRPTSAAMLSASRSEVTPAIVPSSLTNRTLGTVIWALMRGPSRDGAASIGDLAIGRTPLLLTGTLGFYRTKRLGKIGGRERFRL